MLIAGFGRKGHAVGDIPGVRFKVVLGDDWGWLEKDLESSNQSDDEVIEVPPVTTTIEVK